jgi:hypothetical protein
MHKEHVYSLSKLYIEKNDVNFSKKKFLYIDEFYLCKPVTSRMANSETYLVGKGFKGGVYLNHPYIKALIDKISNRSAMDIPIFDARDYSKEFLNIIIKSARELANEQINKIDNDISRTNECIRNNYKGNINNNPVVLEFKKKSENLIEKWFIDNPILPISDHEKIKMKNALGQ